MNKDQMFCRNCGSMIGRTDNFCYKCGVSQRDVVDNNESKKSSPKVSEVLSAIINKPWIRNSFSVLDLGRVRNRRAFSS